MAQQTVEQQLKGIIIDELVSEKGLDRKEATNLVTEDKMRNFMSKIWKEQEKFTLDLFQGF